MQRILGDDRCVARVDGYTKVDGVKGETIVDLAPTTVVRTALAGYPRDTKLLILHNNKLVDASVLYWMGATDLCEGSRHMLNVKPAGAPTGVQAWHSLNQFNHVVTDATTTADIYESTRLQVSK